MNRVPVATSKSALEHERIVASFLQNGNGFVLFFRTDNPAIVAGERLLKDGQDIMEIFLQLTMKDWKCYRTGSRLTQVARVQADISILVKT